MKHLTPKFSPPRSTSLLLGPNILLCPISIIFAWFCYCEWPTYMLTAKGKAISLQVWTGPEGSRRLRLPDFKISRQSAHEGGKVVSPTPGPPLRPPPQEIFLVLICVRGPYCGQRDYASEKFQ